MAREVDPVCGMVVDTESAAASSRFEDQQFYFCSIACKEAFDASPARYARQAGVSADREVPLEGNDPPFTKKDGIVAPKFGAAGSGGAEYEPIRDSNRRDT